MFGETLLESSLAARKRKRWPMAAAFTVEIVLAGIAVLVPLLSTGVIPLSARPRILTPIRVEPVRRVRTDRTATSGPAAPASQPEVIAFDNPNRIPYGDARTNPTPSDDPAPYKPWTSGNGPVPSELIGSGDRGSGVKPGPGRIISVNAEAQLLNRVEPVYPRTAILAGVQGQVRLHAIIARDGRIMSLNVISGSPLLAGAARDAVSQWRYRPYYLNGQPVEVETFITVNFRKETR